MKLEEILPEIRKGRKFGPKGTNIWFDPGTLAGFPPFQIFGEWELEPIPKEIIANGWILQEEPGYGVNIYLRRDELMAQFSFDVIQRMKEFADQLRGGIVQDTQQYNGVDPNYREYELPDITAVEYSSRPASWMCGYTQGHKAGWDARERAQ